MDRTILSRHCLGLVNKRTLLKKRDLAVRVTFLGFKYGKYTIVVDWVRLSRHCLGLVNKRTLLFHGQELYNSPTKFLVSAGKIMFR